MMNRSDISKAIKICEKLTIQINMIYGLESAGSRPFKVTLTPLKDQGPKTATTLDALQIDYKKNVAELLSLIHITKEEFDSKPIQQHKEELEKLLNPKAKYF